MTLQENVPLAPYTTFKIGGSARFFCDVRSVPELVEVVKYASAENLPLLVLGGGSNVLVSDEGFAGVVAHICLKGISMVTEDDSVKITAAAGESWDDFVAYTVGQGLYGLENLSLIPGTVGAAPVQNIGAYGVEVQSTVETVTAIEASSGKLATFNKRQCEFAYRDSYFKTADGKEYIITAVTFRLAKKGKLSLDYKDIAEYYSLHSAHRKTLAGVRDAVIAIRTAKLPDFSKIGTAGSFFKNPVITKRHYTELLGKYSGMPSYPVRPHDIRAKGVIAKDMVKIPLAWILDHICNFKGYRAGNVGVYERQSLVIVNWGGGQSSEVAHLAHKMAAAVLERTGIVIEPEVQYIG